MIQRKSNFTFYYGAESVTLEIAKKHTTATYISFNCYNMQSRRKFNDFKERLTTSGPNEYDNFDEVFGLARQYGINMSNGHKPTFTDHIAF